MPELTSVAGCGVDYLTCTFNSQAEMTTLEFYLARIDRAEKYLGAIPKPWSMSGYHGWKVGQLEYGFRHDGVIVRSHSDVSCQHWQDFAKLATNVSRIDLQYTVVYDEAPAKTLARHFKEMRAVWRKHKRFPEPTMWANAAGVSAVYSGSRTSERYLRLYHRFAKEPDPTLLGHIRYEAELKGAVASSMVQHLLQVTNPQLEIAMQVSRIFKARGVSPADHEASCYNPCSPTSVRDAQRRLRWLRDGVRPAVLELINLGYEDEVRDALGLRCAGQVGQTTLRKE